MATSPSKAEIGLPLELHMAVASPQESGLGAGESPASGQDALQALLAFSAIQEQVRQRRAREAVHNGASPKVEGPDQFLLYEVLQLVAQRALALTNADGIAIALVHEGDIICRASAGSIAPDVGVKLDSNEGFSGLCLRTGESVRCDDAEQDKRVDRTASHRLNARSLLAVPLCGRHSVLGLIEAFSREPFSFDDSDLSSLKLLAELILGAMKPEEQQHLESLSPVAVHRRKQPEQKVEIAKEVPFPAPEKTPALGAAELDALIQQQVEAASGTAAAAPVPCVDPSPVATAEKPEPEAAMPEDSIEPAGTTETQQPTSNSAAEDPLFSTMVASQVDDETHPGLKVAAAIVLIVVLAGIGFWWRLRAKTAEVSAAVTAKPQQTLAVAPTTAKPEVETVSESTPVSEETTISGGELPGRVVAPAHGLLPMITGVRHWESGESTTVVIDLQDQVQYEVHRLADPERIYFDLHDTVLANGLSGKTFEVGDALLVRIRVAQPMPGISRIVLETKDVSNFSVSLEQNPFRLVAAIRKQAPDKKLGTKVGMPGTFLPGEPSDLQAGASAISKEDLQLRARVPRMKIALDAGHGGWDLGTVGRQGLLEKDLVLDVAKRLGGLLESRLGSKVIYTRSDDNYIPLEQRAELANEAQADLFVSVHANYSDYAFARGVETYYTNFSSSPESADIEKRENATAKAAPKPTALSGVALKERTEQSRRLAASVERALYGTLAPNNPGLRDRGVKEAGFVVLTGTSMPAILSEISFVSSPMDERNLQSSSYREHIAEALYKGIARYAASSSRVKMASAAGR